MDRCGRLAAADFSAAQAPRLSQHLPIKWVSFRSAATDEFILRGSLPAQPGPLWFKVRQACVKGEWNWAELPAEGASTLGLKAPAVRLMLTKPPASPAVHAH